MDTRRTQRHAKTVPPRSIDLGSTLNIASIPGPTTSTEPESVEPERMCPIGPTSSGVAVRIPMSTVALGVPIAPEHHNILTALLNVDVAAV